MRWRRLTVEKTAVTAVLTLWYLLCPQIGYENSLTPLEPLWSHALYMVSHANVWHLLGNQIGRAHV